MRSVQRTALPGMSAKLQGDCVEHYFGPFRTSIPVAHLKPMLNARLRDAHAAAKALERSAGKLSWEAGLDSELQERAIPAYSRHLYKLLKSAQ